ncbi:MAG: hypothetical protein LBQ15_11260 [Clostridium sp.]|jgi:hypothetical protein|nr:hypothetical protein [Clostridium sp.]
MATRLVTLKKKNGDAYYPRTSTAQVDGLADALAAKQGALTQAQLDAAGSGITAAKVAAYDGYSGQISGIQGKIPAQADASNQLADKAFVNSTVTSLAANFVAADAQNSNFATKSALTGAETYYHAGEPYQPTGKDYAVVLQDETQGGAQTRYVNVSATETPSWQLQYVVNDAPFTAAQNSALDSGITAAKVAAYDGVVSSSSGWLTAADAASTYATKATVSALGTVYIVQEGADLSAYGDADLVIEIQE